MYSIFTAFASHPQAACKSEKDQERRQAKLVGRRMEVSCLIQNAQFTALWDTGAQVSLISESWLRRNLLPEEYEIRPVSELIDKELRVEGVGSTIPYLGYALLPFQLGQVDRGKAVVVPFLVSEDDTTKIPIIGSNVMEEFIMGTTIEEKLKKLIDHLIKTNIIKT